MIKKLLFIAAITTGMGSLFAQNLDLQDDQNNSIAGRTYYFYDTGTNLASTKLHVGNSSANPINFDITLWEIANSVPSDWQVCFGVNCYIANNSNSSPQTFSSATAPAMGTYTDAKVAPFSFAWSSGDWGVWRVRVYDNTNMSDSSTAYVVWVADGSPTGDQNSNGIIDGGEIAGDVNNNGSIDGGEIAGDVNGNGVIDIWEVSGDENGNGVIDGGEVMSVDRINDKDVNLSAYPNPVLNNLTINYSIDKNVENGTLDLYDVLGQKISTYNLSDNKGRLNINVSDLNAGVYFYSIKIDDKAIKTERVIVK